MTSFKGRHHQQDIILQCVRWYIAYSLSYRDLEELMAERGYAIDHSTIQRWVIPDSKARRLYHGGFLTATRHLANLLPI